MNFRGLKAAVSDAALEKRFVLKIMRVPLLGLKIDADDSL